MRNEIRIGTRGSRLALWQAGYVARQLSAQYPGTEVRLVTISTRGDRVLEMPLAEIGGKGLFTQEIEREISDGRIDMAVHSLKDVPAVLPEGLMIGAVLKRAEARDALVSRSGASLQALPAGARVGTSSLRRRAQLLAVRPDLTVTVLRGNVDTRLKKLEQGGLEAVILAAAGLERLGLGEKITELLPVEIMLPAVGQGILAVELRKDDTGLREQLAFLTDFDTEAAARAERSFLRRIDGSCQVPVGVFAEAVPGGLRLTAKVASLDGRRVVREQLLGAMTAAEQLGKELAERILQNGGQEILQEIGASASDGGEKQ